MSHNEMLNLLEAGNPMGPADHAYNAIEQRGDGDMYTAACLDLDSLMYNSPEEVLAPDQRKTAVKAVAARELQSES